MRLETLLPLGKVDPGLRARRRRSTSAPSPTLAGCSRTLGYDGLVVEETKDDPFVVLALAAQATTPLGVGTSVAIALPAQPDDDGDERLDAAEALAAGGSRSVSARRCVGTSSAGTGCEWSAPGAVDPRVRRGRAGGVGLLAARHRRSTSAATTTRST